MTVNDAKDAWPAWSRQRRPLRALSCWLLAARLPQFNWFCSSLLGPLREGRDMVPHTMAGLGRPLGIRPQNKARAGGTTAVNFSQKLPPTQPKGWSLRVLQAQAHRFCMVLPLLGISLTRLQKTIDMQATTKPFAVVLKQRRKLDRRASGRFSDSIWNRSTYPWRILCMLKSLLWIKPAETLSRSSSAEGTCRNSTSPKSHAAWTCFEAFALLAQAVLHVFCL